MTGRIPQHFIDQLLSRLDIVEIVDSRVDLRKAGREFTACCPFHTEKTPSFTVSPTKQFYHCFGCGAHGNAIRFLMDYEHLEFLDAVEELARSVGLEIPRTNNTHIAEQHTDLIDIVGRAEQFFRMQLRQHPARRKALDYLQQRGLSDEIIERFGIGYAPPGWDSLIKALCDKNTSSQMLAAAGLVIAKDNGGYYDRFRDRIMFPIRDRRGRNIAFGGRAIDKDAAPKYLNSPETPLFHKGQALYGLYEARMSERKLERLLVVEGYMDVVSLAQYGVRYAVATLGTATTTDHLERLFRLSKDIIFCFDGDRAGRQAAWRALENTLALLRDGRQLSFLFLPDGEDPDSLVRKEGKDAFEQYYSQALPFSDYFFDQLSADIDLSTLDGRARLAEKARPLLHKLPDSIFRDMMLQRLADITQVITSRLSALPSTAPMLKRSVNLARNPLRLAIALLLNQPDLASKTGDISAFKGLDIPGLPLLVELIELLQAEPYINNGARILARYEQTETGSILEQLLQARPIIPEECFEEEFLGAIQRLKRDYNPETVLLNKLAQGKLDEREREMLLNLQRQKTTIS